MGKTHDAYCVMMNSRVIYILGIIVILTGLSGIVAGTLAGTPGSIFIGTGLIIASGWMMYQLRQEERKKDNGSIG